MVLMMIMKLIMLFVLPCIEDNTGSHEGATRLIQVSDNDVTIAHLEGNSNEDHADFKYKNINYSKQKLIDQFIHSKKDMNKLQQITANIEKNKAAAIHDFQKEDSLSSSTNNKNVDAKNLTEFQLINWVKAAGKGHFLTILNIKKWGFSSRP